MDAVKKVIEKLQATIEKQHLIQLLQELNKMLLTECMLEIDENLVLYPIEVEAYYYHKSNFPDTCVHKYQWQQNRYGKLYFHRAGSKPETSFLFDEGGVDICLSNSDEFFLGILIRGARINQENEPICTPGLLTRKIVRHICKDETIVKVTEKEAILIRQLEESDNVLSLAINDNRDKESILFHSTRFGINPNNHPEYAQYKLRSLIELSAPNHPFRAKEKVVLDYMIDNKIEPTADNVRKILGSNSNSILEQLKLNH